MSNGGERRRLKLRIIGIVTECEEPGFRLSDLKNLHPNIFDAVHMEAIEDLKAMLVANGIDPDAEPPTDDEPEGPSAA
jgi:hypothetical protein